MSLIIAVYVNEGIVLASDRRITYHNTQEAEDKLIVREGIHITDTTDKTFMCPNGSGISTCGTATIGGSPLTGYIQQFIRENITLETGVDDIPPMLLDFFDKFSNKPDTVFIVAGYASQGQSKVQKLYRVFTKDNRIESAKSHEQGAIWNGEADMLSRLINSCARKNSNGTYADYVQHDILWEYFTLQDAVDFAKYAIETTAKTMRFLNRVKTVGGNVDILIIKPDETKWLVKEELHG